MHRNIENIHHRRSIRLRGRDYAEPGMYFVTICTAKTGDVFGNVQRGEMILNAYGIIADECWRVIPDHFPWVALDAFVIMPDHMHGIVEILPMRACRGVACNAPSKNVGFNGRGRACSAPTFPNGNAMPHGPEPHSLGAIIRSFKSAVTHRVNDLQGVSGQQFWQRNYYDRIIRSHDLDGVRRYIMENPKRWTQASGASSVPV